MKIETTNHKRFHRVVSFMLAAVMMVSVFSVSVPQKAEAAGLALKGSGSSSVTITDDTCSSVTGDATYIKFKSNVTGYISLKFTSASNITEAYGYVTFCGGKKKALGKTQELFDTASAKAYLKNRTYGVKKGATYYIKVESVGGVKVSATVKAVKKSAGTKRSNAKTLAKGKTASGVIVAGSSAADWYKIKLTKKQQLKLIYSAKTNGAVASGKYIYYSNGIKFTLYKSDGKPFVSDYDMANLLNSSGTGTYYLENTYTKAKSGLNPGTYYIKVERYNNTSSGYYTLKWK